MSCKLDLLTSLLSTLVLLLLSQPASCVLPRAKGLPETDRFSDASLGSLGGYNIEDLIFSFPPSVPSSPKTETDPPQSPRSPRTAHQASPEPPSSHKGRSTSANSSSPSRSPSESVEISRSTPASSDYSPTTPPPPRNRSRKTPRTEPVPAASTPRERKAINNRNAQRIYRERTKEKDDARRAEIRELKGGESPERVPESSLPKVDRTGMSTQERNKVNQQVHRVKIKEQRKLEEEELARLRAAKKQGEGRGERSDKTTSTAMAAGRGEADENGEKRQRSPDKGALGVITRAKKGRGIPK